MKKEDKSMNNNFGLLSVTFGIMSIVCAIGLITGFVAGLIFGVLALIFGIKQSRLMKNNWSKWGISLSVIGIIINIVVFAWFVVSLADLISQYQDLQQGLTEYNIQ